MRQRPAAELLDTDQGTPAELAASLDDLWWIQRRLGGLSSLRRLLAPWRSQPAQRPLRVLDVGAGAGQTSAYLRDWLAAQGADWTMFALDRRFSHLQHGRPVARGLRAVVADALALPFPDGSFDLVLCSLFLHHFHGAAAQALLREMQRVTRGALVVHDLERSALALLFFRLVSPFVTSRITRHDGAVSIQQAYSAREMAALARGAGLGDGGVVEVRRLWPFRLGLVSARAR